VAGTEEASIRRRADAGHQRPGGAGALAPRRRSDREAHEDAPRALRRAPKHYGIEVPRLYDRDLRRIFSADPAFKNNPAATRFLRRVRREVRKLVATWTGAYQYTVDQVFEDIVNRCRELELRLAVPEAQAKLDFAVLLTVQTMNFLHSGRHRVAL
jgi:hypothetical protein